MKQHVDSPGTLLLRLSSLTCFPPLMENVESGDEPQSRLRVLRGEPRRQNQERGAAPVGLGDHVPAFLKRAVRLSPSR